MSSYIREFSDARIEDASSFDVLLGAITGESRGWDVVETLSHTADKVLCLYRLNEHLAGPGLLAEIGVRLPKAQVMGVEGLVDYLSAFLEPRATADVCVDVSCMTRSDMAAVFAVLLASNKRVGASLRLTIFYSIAEFSIPSTHRSVNEHIKPISGEFAGWPDDASAATSLLVGLGYELGKADGACEYFDASGRWVFFPESPLPEYDAAVLSANSLLCEDAERRGRLIRYRVDSPADVLGRVAAVVADQYQSANLLLLPFGPKIFVAVCLLAASEWRSVGVWHATGDTDLPPIDHRSSGKTVGLNVVLQWPHETSEATSGF